MVCNYFHFIYLPMYCMDLWSHRQKDCRIQMEFTFWLCLKVYNDDFWNYHWSITPCVCYFHNEITKYTDVWLKCKISKIIILRAAEIGGQGRTSSCHVVTDKEDLTIKAGKALMNSNLTLQPQLGSRRTSTVC